MLTNRNQHKNFRTGSRYSRNQYWRVDDQHTLMNDQLNLVYRYSILTKWVFVMLMLTIDYFILKLRCNKLLTLLKLLTQMPNINHLQLFLHLNSTLTPIQTSPIAVHWYLIKVFLDIYLYELHSYCLHFPCFFNWRYVTFDLVPRAEVLYKPNDIICPNPVIISSDKSIQCLPFDVYVYQLII